MHDLRSLLQSSVVPVVEFLSGAGKNQQIFTLKRASQKIFFVFL